MICKIFFFRTKKFKMLDQSIYTPSGGIGEIEFIPEEKNWYKTESV